MRTVLIVVLLIVLAGLGVWYFTRGPEEPGPAGPDGGNGSGVAARGRLTGEQALRLTELKNTGLGHLENHQFLAAIAAFEELTRDLPDEPLGWRNLAIAHVLRIEQGLNPQNAQNSRDTGAPDAELLIGDKAQAIADARAILDELARREPDSCALHFLRGKLAGLDSDSDLAAREMSAAAEAAAQDENLSALVPGVFHEAHEQSLPSQSEEIHALGQAALMRAADAAPDNLFLAVLKLRVQAEQQDPRIAASLAALRPEIEAVAPEVKQHNPAYDVVAILDAAEAAVAGSNWAAAFGQCSGLKNLVQVSSAYKSDRDYAVALHVLDFVASDTASFQARLPPIMWPDEGVPVEFRLFTDQIPHNGLAVLDARAADMDLDGRLDVCVLRPGRIEAWRSVSAGGWELFTSADVPEGYTRLLVCDLDDDAQNSPHAPKAAGPPGAVGARSDIESEGSQCRGADPDVVLYGEAGVLMLESVWDRETGARSLTRPTGPVLPPGATPLEGPLWPDIKDVDLVIEADLNLDGDLDLLLFTKSGPRLWSNRNSFLFQDVTDRVAFPPGSERVVAAFPVDWDRDVDLDVVLAMQDGTVGVLEALRHLTFRWRPLADINAAATNALAVVELDGNASWDLLIGGPNAVQAVLTRTPVTGRVVTDKTDPIGGFAAQGLDYWDYDNDGIIDVVAWNRDQVRVARGLPGGGFQVQADLLTGLPLPASLRRCEVGDVDGDGDGDLLVIGESGTLLCSNEGGNANGWVDMTLAAQFSLEKTGTQTRRTNHYGVGSTLELKAGPHYQAQVVRGQSIHFGLGKRARADVVRVTWTNGFPENTMQPEQKQNICQVETPKGSCPFLYTWNGERFVFATDLCWAAPLGMLTPQGGLMPGRSWEYLLISGDLLAPRDGRYVLQCTAELWEAEYFDQVELIAVDHPDDIEVYSNEKVGPPEITEFKVHTARTRQRPRSARAHSGRDLLPELTERDGVYARPFEHKRMQGYTEDSIIELDLGALPDPADVRLFLTGWMFPTDTSINVALAENPALPGPQPPSLWVPDANGEWQQVIPHMGFPGGKTKTIVVDLSGKFLCEDYRVRIATSMEIYWDEIFFTSGEQPGEYTLTPLTAVAADLHFRGFSRRIPRPHHGPPDFDYDDVRTEPAWASMGGFFTRYGDVTELITSADDRMAILFAGDEMSVEFDAPPPPPPGWKRDFILHNVGWDKDADLNTVLGQTVEPLPFAAMSRYPYPPDEQYPDTPLHREYLRMYQTRTIDDAPFRRLIHAWQPGTELVSP